MIESIDQQPIGVFLDALASDAPTPGGGSAAALTGAMAAGLVSMVCALTVGKRQYADVEDEVRASGEQSERLRKELQGFAQDDVDIFSRLSGTYKLPRTTQADAASRRAAIQTVTRQAAEIPLRAARTAAQLVPLCQSLARTCNRNVVSDIGVAVVLTRAAIQTALLNVEVNLEVLEDARYVREVRAQTAALTDGLDDAVAGVLAIVQERIQQ